MAEVAAGAVVAGFVRVEVGVAEAGGVGACETREQRLGVEVAWEGLEDAGVGPQGFTGGVQHGEGLKIYKK